MFRSSTTFTDLQCPR